MSRSDAKPPQAEIAKLRQFLAKNGLSQPRIDAAVRSGASRKEMALALRAELNGVNPRYGWAKQGENGNRYLALSGSTRRTARD
jgi:hypothetical protein